MSARLMGFDPVCPTNLELPDDVRRALPLLPWAAHHRAVRATSIPLPYAEVLHEEEQAWLLHQAGFTGRAMSWQARVIDRGTNAELWLTVCGRDLRTAEANALAKAAFQLQANPAELDAVSVHQLPMRKDAR